VRDQDPLSWFLQAIGGRVFREVDVLVPSDDSALKGNFAAFLRKVRVCGHAGDVQNATTHALEAPHPNGDHVWCGSAVVFNVSIILSWSKKLKPLKTVKTSPDVV
jgi:hypothetical protein